MKRTKNKTWSQVILNAIENKKSLNLKSKKDEFLKKFNLSWIDKEVKRVFEEDYTLYIYLRGTPRRCISMSYMDGIQLYESNLIVEQFTFQRYDDFKGNEQKYVLSKNDVLKRMNGYDNYFSNDIKNDVLSDDIVNINKYNDVLYIFFTRNRTLMIDKDGWYCWAKNEIAHREGGKPYSYNPKTGRFNHDL